MRQRINKTGFRISNGIPFFYTESDPEFEKRLDLDIKASNAAFYRKIV
jgi:hypothetical protein